MKKNILAELAMVIFVIVVGMPISANAALITSGTVYYDWAERNLVYDTDLDITWLDYSHGVTNWDGQVAWANDLSFTIDGVTYDNWRLPSAGASPLVGYNDTSSEMGHLFYSELRMVNQTIGGVTSTAKLNSSQYFDNLIAGFFWSGTENDDGSSNSVWAFYTNVGSQGATASKDYDGYGLAVIDGQVAPVPIPSTSLLLGTGLAGLIGARRKKG